MTGRPVGERTVRKVVTAGAVYFALVFASGFALGAVRVTRIAPRIGERAAELLETPFMLAVIVLSSRWVVRRYALPPSPGIRLGTGMVALVLMLAAEFGIMLRLRGLTIVEYLATRDPVSGTVYYLSLGVFAIVPLVMALTRRKEAGG